MNRQGVIWPAGLVASAALHGGAALALVWALEPDPVSEQPAPETRMQVETYEIDRTQAPEAEPDAEAAREQDADGVDVGQGAVPQSSAEPVEPQLAALAPVDQSGTALSARQPSAVTASDLSAAQSSLLAAVQPPEASAPDVEADSELLSASQAAAVQLPSVEATASIAPPVDAPARQSTPLEARPETVSDQVPSSTAIAADLPTVETSASVTIAPNRAQAVSATPAALPSTTVPSTEIPATSDAGTAIPTTEPETDALASADTQGATLPDAQPNGDALAFADVQGATIPDAKPNATTLSQATGEAEDLSPAEPDVIKGTAELAFAGADGSVDPVSLAAFQSFMAPESAAAAEVRDGVNSLLSQVPCSRLQVTFQPESNTLQLTGHVPEDGLRGPVLEALQTQMGADIAVADNLLVLPSPQCNALTGIADVGLAQSTDQITNPLIVGEDTHARVFDYKDGDRLILDLTAPDYDAYIYVDYFDAKGQVIHLSPNDTVPLKLAVQKSALRIGADNPGDPGLYITIGPPYGQEIAVAFASSVALYEGARPLVEPADAYLAWLSERVAEARAANPDFKGEWVYFFISTRAE